MDDNKDNKNDNTDKLDDNTDNQDKLGLSGAKLRTASQFSFFGFVILNLMRFSIISIKYQVTNTRYQVSNDKH